jgi:hypothetical protein
MTRKAKWLLFVSAIIFAVLWVAQPSHLHGDGGDAYLLMLLWLLTCFLAACLWIILVVTMVEGANAWARGSGELSTLIVAFLLWAALTAVAAISYLTHGGALRNLVGK